MIVPLVAQEPSALWTVLKRTANSWDEHNAFRLSASMAFYSLLSLAPLIVLIIAIASIVFSHTSAENRILAEVQSTVGAVGADAIRDVLKNPPRHKSGILTSVVGFLTLLFGASAVFGELRDSLNTMWDVKYAGNGGIMKLIRERAAMFGMVLAVGFLLLVSLVISAITAAMGRYFTQGLPAPEAVLHLASNVISLVAITILFALIFKYVPDLPIEWKDVWVGAFVTSLLFTIGKFIIGLYLGKAGVGSAYGAAGSMIAITVWVYYSSLIFFFGAEFTHEYACFKHEQAAKDLLRPRAN